MTLSKYQHSPSCMDFVMFLVECQKAVKSSKMTETILPPHIQPLYDYLEKIDKQLDEVPPVESPMRFGNKAFKSWVELISVTAAEDLQ